MALAGALALALAVALLLSPRGEAAFPGKPGLGFFVTPILYLIENVQSRPLRALLRVNPMTPFVVSYQDIFFFGRLPNTSDTFLMLAYASVSLWAGIFVFGRLRDTLAEAI